MGFVSLAGRPDFAQVADCEVRAGTLVGRRKWQ